MKKISAVCLLLLVLLSGGCNNSYTVKTRIHGDGSFEKTITCTGDSLGIYQLPLPYDFNDGWKIEIRKDTGKTSAFITTATKTYRNSDDLQAEGVKGYDSSKLKIRSTIEKHFRWFFTYYTYQETIPAFGLFKQAVRFDSVFTPVEIERMARGEDSLLSKRFDEYWYRNIMEDLIDELIVRTQTLNDPALAPSRWRERRSAIIESISTERMKKNADFTAAIQEVLPSHSERELGRIVDSTVKNIIVEKADIERKLENAYHNEVIMPGMILASNAEKVEGSVLTWNRNPHRYIDLVMTAESRTINLWAVITTAIVCLALLAGLLLPMIRMKNRPL